MTHFKGILSRSPGRDPCQKWFIMMANSQVIARNGIWVFAALAVNVHVVCYVVPFPTTMAHCPFPHDFCTSALLSIPVVPVYLFPSIQVRILLFRLDPSSTH